MYPESVTLLCEMCWGLILLQMKTVKGTLVHLTLAVVCKMANTAFNGQVGWGLHSIAVSVNVLERQQDLRAWHFGSMPWRWQKAV